MAPNRMRKPQGVRALPRRRAVPHALDGRDPRSCPLVDDSGFSVSRRGARVSTGSGTRGIGGGMGMGTGPAIATNDLGCPAPSRLPCRLASPS